MLAGFTFDHRILRRGEPVPWESGWDGLYPEDRPWLARGSTPLVAATPHTPPKG